MGKIELSTSQLAHVRAVSQGIDWKMSAERYLAPSDPASIEAAIAESERLVDERLGTYAGNTIVGPLIQQMKDAFRTAVIEKATEARLKEDEADGE